MVGVVFDWDDPDDAKGNTQRVRSHGGFAREFEEAPTLTAPGPHSRSSGRPLIDGRGVAGRRVIIVSRCERVWAITIRPITAYPPERLG